MKKLNKFITAEGIEGSGKSTVLKMVVDTLSVGTDILLTREPGGSSNQFSEDIRSLIMKYDNISSMTELLLFESARKEHIINTMQPAIEDGKVVICDRYVDSSLVYQGINGEVGVDYTNSLNEIVAGEFMPSLTLIFDLSPEISLKRINPKDREVNKFDLKSIEYHNKIRESYLELSKTDERFVVVDASKTLEEVYEDVLKIIKEHLD